MKILFDTSVLVAAVVEPHPMHRRALPWLQRAKAEECDFVVASHTLAELYAVLTTLPVRPRISPAVAWRLVHENVETSAKIVSLTPSDYRSTVKGNSGDVFPYSDFKAPIVTSCYHRQLFEIPYFLGN